MEELMALFNSPSMLKYLTNAKSFQLTPDPEEPVAGPSTAPCLTSPYLTRARTQAPFSPPRTATHRSGQVYHVTDPNYEQNEDIEMANDGEDAPIVHIPDNVEAYAQDCSISDNAAYAEFLDHLKDFSEEQTAKPVDDRKKDPTFYLRKRDHYESDEEYVKPVSAREIKHLKEDLEANPIPGLSLVESAVAEEPFVVTRSAARSRTSDLHGTSPFSPPPEMIADYKIPRGRFSQETSNDSDTIAARTRAQSAKTPQKYAPVSNPTLIGYTPIANNFKKPFPVEVPAPAKLAKSLPKKVLPGKSSEDGEGEINSEITPVLTEEEAAFIKSRFKVVGEKFKHFLANDAFSSDEKSMVTQVLNYIVHSHSKKEALVLAEYIMRIVGLVSGEYVVSQVHSFFEEAKRVNSDITYLIFGLLVHDGSAIILELAPILYAKTRLLKDLHAELVRVNQQDEKREIIRIAKIALRANDHPYYHPKVDLASPFASRLKITGAEGLMEEKAFEHVEVETVYNTEDVIQQHEAFQARAKELLANEAQEKAGNNNQGTHTRFIPIASNAADSSEVASDNSNSSNHLGHAYPAIAHGNRGLHTPDNVHSYGVADCPVPSTSTGTGFNEQRLPRRVQFSTTTASPVKNPVFIAAASPSRYQLRSAAKAPT